MGRWQDWNREFADSRHIVGVELFLDACIVIFPLGWLKEEFKRYFHERRRDDDGGQVSTEDNLARRTGHLKGAFPKTVAGSKAQSAGRYCSHCHIDIDALSAWDCLTYRALLADGRGFHICCSCFRLAVF